jgi:nucleoside phosphorylase
MVDTAAKQALTSSHEAAFPVQIARMATEKKINISKSPIVFKTVKSPLIEPMFKTYIGTLSGVFVVHAANGMGKTQAAMYFMKSIRPQSPGRGIMVGCASH